MKIIIEVSGGAISNIVATQECSIYLVDHDNLQESAGHDPQGRTSPGDIAEIRQAMQPYRITYEEGLEETPEFDDCLAETLAEYAPPEDCDICGGEHPKGFDGDCRDDANREPHKITAKDGLLWCNGEMIPLPEADRVARERGYGCAEQLVKALEKAEPKKELIGYYNLDGYRIEDNLDGTVIYEAGNSPHESSAVVDREEGLPLATLKEYCERTGREIAAEKDATFAGAFEAAEEDCGREPDDCQACGGCTETQEGAG